MTQLEILHRPPDRENKPMIWPFWPLKMRTSTSHEEGCVRDWAVRTTKFTGSNGRVNKLHLIRLNWENGDNGPSKMQEIEGTEFSIDADLVFLAMGFMHPVHDWLLNEIEVELDARGNVRADTEAESGAYQTNIDNVFTCGDMRRGQSLVVWAIREGRQCARSVDQFLMGHSDLPR